MLAYMGRSDMDLVLISGNTTQSSSLEIEEGDSAGITSEAIATADQQQQQLSLECKTEVGSNEAICFVHFFPIKMSFTPPPPPVFTRENYHFWVVKMKTYLQAHDLWNVIENDAEPPPLRANPTTAQMRQHSEEL
ncbi:hypothetical protein Gotur_021197 [Gossypium turneri]